MSGVGDDNNDVIVVDNKDCGDLEFPESEPIGQAFISQIGLTGTWKQTSYNGTIRKNYAGIGYTYDAGRDAFIAPQPYVSWVLNETSCKWEAPTQMPADGAQYLWNEDSTSWQPVN